MRLYGQIEKAEVQEDGTIIVSGYASSEDVDSQGEIVKASAMKDALPAYMEFANIREMHQAKAAGVALEADVQEDGRTWIKAHIVDSDAVKKVQNKVYKGFSIGGSVTGRDDVDKSIITGITLSEISLVDRPANPSAVFSMGKVDLATDIVAGTREEAIELLRRQKAEKAAADEPKGQYGDVDYADTKNKKYPIDTAEHIRAAWNYIHQKKNQEGYTPEEVAEIEKNIIAAWKDKIDKKGPPSANDDSDKAAATGDIEKGMYTVSLLAQLLDTINQLQQCSENEEAMEGDKSTVPDQLKTWLDSGSQILRDMTIEETSELTAADKTGDLGKAGARNSKSDMEKLQAIHDSAVAMGADCDGDDDNEEKHDHTGNLAKLADMQEQLSKLADENADLKKRVEELEDMPQPTKGSLMSVAKEEDVRDLKKEEAPKNAFEAIKKAHMTPMILMPR